MLALVHPVNGPTQVVLDPQLGAEDSLVAIKQRMERMEADLNSMKKKSTSPDGEDADDEDSGGSGDTSGARRTGPPVEASAWPSGVSPGHPRLLLRHLTG